MNQPVSPSITPLPTTTSGPAAATANGSTGGAGSGTILLPHPSPSLAAQAMGQVIRAVVIGPTGDGKFIVDTRYGKFTLTLTTNPAPGTVLQLQIVKSGTPVELLLIGSQARLPSAQAAAIIRLSLPPPALLTLTKGELFRGRVVNSSPDGKTIVDTRYGQLSLPLANAPAKGSSLQLQIVKPGTPLELRLVSAEAPPASQVSTAKAATPATLTVGETVSGRYAPAASGSPTPAGPAAGGSAAAPTASAAGGSAPAGPAAGGLATGGSAAGGAAAGGSAAAPTGLAAGNFHARIVAIHTAAPAAATAGNEAVVTGRVVASPAGGPTVIETAAGRIVLPTTGGGVANRYVTLQILAEPGTVLPTNPNTAHLRSLMSLSHNWTALEDVIETATASNPQIAAQFTAGSIPNTGATLTAGIALFLAILTRGRMPEWLGPDIVRLMESANRQALLGELGDDFSQIVRLAGEPTHGDWRVAMLPLLHDGFLQQIRLYLRERLDDGESDDNSLGTRFVIEASLSHLGDIQLDGLVRRNRFDLMVRTQEPLPRTMRTDIAALFNNANEEFGVQGRINFQVQPRFPVDPVDELTDHAVGVYA